MRVRYVVVCGLLMAAAVTSRAQLSAQEDEWRVRFDAGERARQAGDHVLYADEMTAAAEALPPGVLNRPFIQYHAARASALAGNSEAAIRWLRTTWDEASRLCFSGDSLRSASSPRSARAAWVNAASLPGRGSRGPMSATTRGEPTRTAVAGGVSPAAAPARSANARLPPPLREGDCSGA